MTCPFNGENLELSVRPARKSAGEEYGISEALIKQVVYSFYDKVREDDMLGPIFNHHVEDWEMHLNTLCAFWSSVLLTTGRYKGTPMQVHARLANDKVEEVGEAQFSRWLSLFELNAHAICGEADNAAAADLFIDRAHRIARSLQMTIGLQQGQLLP